MLEALWSALRSKDVYTVGAGKSGDPRAGLIPDALWSVHSGSILTALGLDADPDTHLRKLAGDLGEVDRELAGSLDANPAVTIRGGRLSPAKLEAAPLPEAYPVVHDAVMKMLPRIDYPSCCWRSTATPACSTRSATSPGRRPAGRTWTSAWPP